MSSTFSRSLADEAESKARLIERMFEDHGLNVLRSKSPLHPAVQRYDRFKALVQSGNGLTYPDEIDLLRDLLSMAIDFSVVPFLAQTESFWSFIPSEAARRRLAALIQKADQFEDVLAELYAWGWFIQNGDDAEIVERSGHPDILVRPSGRDQFWVEVKRIHLGTASKRVRSIIAKASKQIRSVDPEGAGVVLISVSTDLMSAALDDRVPAEIAAVISEAQRSLNSHDDKSAARVVISWDELQITGEPPDETIYTAFRRSVILDHHAPRRLISIPISDIHMRTNATTQLTWSPSIPQSRTLLPISARDVEVSKEFRKKNEFVEGIRAVHAIEAMRNPDEWQVFAVDDSREMEIIVATRRITRTSPAHTLIVLSFRQRNGRPVVFAGYRLYDSTVEDEALAKHPISAFATFLERFGADISVNGLVSRFLPAVIVKGVNPEIITIGIVGSRSGDMNCFGKAFLDGGEPYSLVQWAYCVDTVSYHTMLAKYRGAG